MREEDCIGRVRMTNLVRQRLPSEDNKEFNGSVSSMVVPPLLFDGGSVEKKEKVFSFFLFSFFPLFSEILGSSVRGGETEAFWFFLHGVPD